MADVYDRWHKSRPGKDELRCREHDKVPTADHGVGKRWQVRYRDANGRQKKENFDRKPPANDRAKEVGADLLRGVHFDPKAGRVSLGAYAVERWLPAQVHLRRNSIDLYRSHLLKHIVPKLGDRQIRAIARTDLKAFVASLGAELAPATVTTVYAVLRTMMAGAVDDGLIPANPCSRVPLPLVEPRVLQPLTAAQVQALAAAITPRYEVAVWLGACAGLREGEVFGLLASRVLFLQRRLLVEEQGQNGVMAPLKTKASKAPVPLDDFVLNKIAAHLKAHPVTANGLVVTNRSGKMLRRGGFGWCWQEAVKAAGLPKGTRFHDLRHAYASLLIAENLHPKVIQARLRHATLAETMDTYGHLFPEHEEAGRGAFDAAFGAGSAPVVPSLQIVKA
jgi:integrase